MKFKKIYIEITNICNLKCSFCSEINKPKKEMSTIEFEEIIKKIDKYTEYIYLHVKGEPLTHSKLDEILSIANKYHKKVCITTNGVLLKEKLTILNKYNNIYQINISLHSENKKQNYLDDIFYSIDNLKYPYINLRLWNVGKENDKIKDYIDRIKYKYNINEIKNGIKIDNKVYLSINDEFIWPSLNNNYYNEDGCCLGGKSHLAILNDGTVSICCLDCDGISNLGNIYQTSMEEIISSSKFKNTISNFQKRKCYLDICKHCSYKERFNK